MNQYYWSASTNVFYAVALREEYEASGSLPSDITDIDDSVASVFMGMPPEGKERGVGADNMPAWNDVPLPSQAQLVSQADVKKTELRAAADSEIVWRQDAVDAGIATDEEIAALADWKKYRVLLMRVDTAKPVWPTLPTA
ncbi:tail fiber assembly protein [Salmonella enterica]|nr:tail fiber assembly protein [Salmonella enterica]